MASNRATVRVKRDKINEKVPSMQQGLCKCGWGVRVTGGFREKQSRNPALFSPHMSSNIGSQCSVAHIGI